MCALGFGAPIFPGGLEPAQSGPLTREAAWPAERLREEPLLSLNPWMAACGKVLLLLQTILALPFFLSHMPLFLGMFQPVQEHHRETGAGG